MLLAVYECHSCKVRLVCTRKTLRRLSDLFLDLQIFPFRKFYKEQKIDNMSVPDPENKVDVVKQTIEIGKLFLEPLFQYVVTHCRLKNDVLATDECWTIFMQCLIHSLQLVNACFWIW